MRILLDIAKSKWARWGSLVLAWTALAIGLHQYSLKQWPVRDVNGDEYWNRVLNLNGNWSRAHLPRDGWFLGAQTGLHGSILFRVAEPEACAAFEEVSRTLEGLAPRQVDYVQKGIDAWLDTDRKRADPMLLLSCIHQAHLDAYREQPEMQEYVRRVEQSLDERWRRAKHYWLNILFEGVYLSALCLFLWWPWLRQAAPWRWALHLGLSPLLLFLPYYLGYAMLTFTTAAQPGGVFYPEVLHWFRQPLLKLIGGWSRQLPWTEFDGWLIETLPKPLAPISQIPGEMMVISGTGGVGPVFLLELGVLLAATVCAVCYAGPILAHVSKSQKPIDAGS